MQKHGSADGSHDDTERQLGGPHHHARDDIGDQHQRGAEQRAGRQDETVIGPRDQTHEMRDDDADEADDAGDGDGRTHGGGGDGTTNRLVASTSMPR